MSDGLTRISQARETARRARLRLKDDVELLRQRAQPAKLAGDAAREMAEHVWLRPAAVVASAAAVGLSVAVPGLRRWGFALGRVAWRNRSPLGRFIIATLPALRRMDRKDR
ncbi:hypothetical protein [Sphingomonas quercus]|uniref:YqjK-like protein n=1 Tax=Sphingomonas quercus TaxID=2842451 RepID=A0ABS6BDL5_9SPHN|nr:hypothetical protein [Sphingomonas quercus]MBU3076388.1 hypothetical protein [Sphingomonas quercus]